jgi:hypothetical protein
MTKIAYLGFREGRGCDMLFVGFVRRGRFLLRGISFAAGEKKEHNLVCKTSKRTM